MLTDAGPLVALIDSTDSAHERCVDALAEIPLPMVTTWSAFTEAMYLLGRHGWAAQDALWRLVRRGDLILDDLEPDGIARTSELMRRYADRPMDLADATLVALAERDDHRRIFTLDADFHVYRTRSRRALAVLP